MPMHIPQYIEYILVLATHVILLSGCVLVTSRISSPIHPSPPHKHTHEL